MLDMPLYPTDQQIALALFGPGKQSQADWATAKLLWRKGGLPMPDPVFKRHYWPAVVAWLDSRAGLRPDTVPSMIEGEENFSGKARQKYARP